MESGSKKWWVLSVTSLGSLLSALNFSMLIIALPELIRSLHASVLQGMWVLLSYMIVQTIVVLLAGSIADRVGRKKLYIWGMAIFSLGSLLCGFGVSADWLILLRVLQGIGGAMVMANSTAIVADIFPREELGRALGINITVVAVGQIIGPVLGGWITVMYGWRWTFWFNVPIGIFVVAWGIWAMGIKDTVSAAAKNKRFDIWGLATYTISITGLLIAMTWGPIQTWNTPVVWIAGILFIMAFPLFIYIENNQPFALLHLPLFMNRTFAMGIVTAALNGIARMAVLIMLIFYFQGALGYDALKAGILTIPLAVGMLVVSPLSGWLGDRFGERAPTTIGLFVNVIGLVGLAVDISLTVHYILLALWMTVISIGAGLFNSPNTSSLMNAAGSHYRGEASGIRSLTVNLAMIFSFAFSMPIISESIPHEVMLAIFSGTKSGMTGGSASMAGFIHGLKDVFWMMSALVMFATVLSVFRSKRKLTINEGITAVME